MIHSRVVWMLRPVERSITVSEPHLIDQRIFSTSSSIEEATAELPMLALIFTSELRPIIIGSVSGWLTLAGRVARPPAVSSRPRPGARPPRGAPASAPADTPRRGRHPAPPRVVHLGDPPSGLGAQGPAHAREPDAAERRV